MATAHGIGSVAEVGSIFQLKGAGAAAVTTAGYDSQMLLTTKDDALVPLTILATDFSQDTADGLNIYQNAAGAAEFDVGFGSAAHPLYYRMDPVTGQFGIGATELRYDVAGVISVAGASKVYTLLGNSGTGSAYNQFQVRVAHVSGGSTDSEFDQDLTAVADATTGFYSTNINLYGKSRGGVYSPGFQLGLNGTFSGATNTLDVFCFWDYTLAQNIWCANHTNAILMGANTAIIGANGANYLQFPTLYGGPNATSTLNLISTTATGTTDAINLKVGTNGGTTGLTVNHDGTVTLPASTFSLGGKTCSIVATILTCV
jgi:hypothetical protein